MAAPLSVLGTELLAVVPIANLAGLRAAGVDLRCNAFAATAAGLAAACLSLGLGDPLQWSTLAAGGYITFSWVQSFAARDKAAFGTIFGSRGLLAGYAAMGSVAFVGYGAVRTRIC